MATPLEPINKKVLVGMNIVCACLFIRRKSKAWKVWKTKTYLHDNCRVVFTILVV